MGYILDTEGIKIMILLKRHELKILEASINMVKYENLTKGYATKAIFNFQSIICLA